MKHLGTFSSIKEAWGSYPQGGFTGSYIIVDGVEYVWNDQKNIWGDETEEEAGTAGEPLVKDQIDVNILNVKKILTYKEKELLQYITDFIKDYISSNIDIDGIINDYFENNNIESGSNINVGSITAYTLKVLTQIVCSEINANKGTFKELITSRLESDSIYAKSVDIEDVLEAKQINAKELLNALVAQIKSLISDSITTTELVAVIAKITDTISANKANFRGTLSSKDYVGDMLGWSIDQYGNVEFENIKARRSLIVPTLIYNRVEIQVGDKWNAPGGGEIDSITPDRDGDDNILFTGSGTMKLEDGEIGAIKVGDICYGIFHSFTSSENSTEDYDDGIGNRRFAGFFTSYFWITDVSGENNQYFRYSVRPISDRYPVRYSPCAQMTFVGYGSFSDKDRQKSRYSTRTYERYLDGVNTWEYNVGNIAAQFGDLSNLSILGLNMTGYSMYFKNAYMAGTIEQLKNLPLKMNIEFTHDSLAPNETGTATVTVTQGFDDVTESIKTWEWTRDSGDTASDTAWNVAHLNSKDVLDISYDDLGENSLTNNATIFTIKASTETTTLYTSIKI